MARSVNKVILIGHLGDEPELRYTESGTAVCNMSLATDESYVDNDGHEVDRTEWHDVVAWGRLAEICGEHLSKGSQVHFEGSLQTNQWEDQEGNTRYSTEVKAREMMFLDSNRQGQSPGHSSPKPQSSGQPNGGQSERPGGKSERTSSEPPTNGNQSREKGNRDDDTFEPDDDLPF